MCVPQYQCKDPGQLAAVGSCVMWVLGLNPGHQVWQQMPFYLLNYLTGPRGFYFYFIIFAW